MSLTLLYQLNYEIVLEKPVFLTNRWGYFKFKSLFWVFKRRFSKTKHTSSNTLNTVSLILLSLCSSSSACDQNDMTGPRLQEDAGDGELANTLHTWDWEDMEMSSAGREAHHFSNPNIVVSRGSLYTTRCQFLNMHVPINHHQYCFSFGRVQSNFIRIRI